MNKHIKPLKKYNAWRRGSEIAQPHPTDIGEALDYAVDKLEENERKISILTDARVQAESNNVFLKLENERLKGGGWIKCEDELPIDYKNVKTHETIEVIIISGGKSEFCEFTCGPLPEPWYTFHDYHKAFVTHWMPKPTPPTK